MSRSERRLWRVQAVLLLCTVWNRVGFSDGLNTYVLDMKFRQLMLDDAVPFASKGVEKVYFQPKDLDKPVLEGTAIYEVQTTQLSEPHVYYDRAEKLFRMWYWSDYRDADRKKEITPLCYAESADGIRWTKPRLGLVDFKGDQGDNNIISEDFFTPTLMVLPEGHPYRFLIFDPHGAGKAAFSRDGKKIDSMEPIRFMGTLPNQENMYRQVGKFISDGYRLLYDPVDLQYHAAVKSWAPLGGSLVPAQWRRTIAFGVSADGVQWTFRERMLECDLADDAFVQTISPRKDKTLPAWAEIEQMTHYRYEGLIIGHINVIHFYDRYLGGYETSSHLVWSRGDYVNWARQAMRKPFLFNEPGTPYWGFSKGVGPLGPLRVGNELWFYRDVSEGMGNEGPAARRVQWFTLAKLRIDGFAGYQAGETEGYLDTQEFVADGAALRVNADCSHGELHIEVLEVEGERVWPAHLFKNTLVAGFTRDSCIPIHGDVDDQPVQWTGNPWSDLKGRRVRLRFYLKGATLFSFWTRADQQIVGIQQVIP
ncbi:MAG: hypothetical protein HYU36_25475 [Planctomycetes bacterium]|nr:hypothetical protein [Planctomycetota bacterium]